MCAESGCATKSHTTALFELGGGMDGQRSAVVYPHLAQQPANMRLDGALIDLQRKTDLAIGSPCAKQLKHL